MGRRPELLVKGWVASGSNEERTELDMMRMAREELVVVES